MFSVSDEAGVYTVHNQSVSWTEARDICLTSGGHLVNTFPVVPSFIRNFVTRQPRSSIKPFRLPDIDKIAEKINEAIDKLKDVLGDSQTEISPQTDDRQANEYWIGQEMSPLVWLKGRLSVKP